MVVRCDPVRPPGRRSPLRRRQPPSTAGEGEAGTVPHPTLCTTRLSELAQGHDRGQPGEEAHGKHKESDTITFFVLLLVAVSSKLIVFFTDSLPKADDEEAFFVPWLALTVGTRTRYTNLKATTHVSCYRIGEKRKRCL